MNIKLTNGATAKIIKDSENGCTIADLKMNSSTKLTVMRKGLTAPTKVPLLNDDKTDLNQRAISIF